MEKDTKLSDRKKREASRVPIAPVDNMHLKKLRLAKKWSQKHLSKMTKISLPTIARLEQNPQPTTTSVLAALARAYDVPIGTLMGEQVSDISRCAASPGTINHLVKFLNQVFLAGPAVPELLGAMTVFLGADFKKVATTACSMEREEEVLGLWSSIIAAYKNADWDHMCENIGAFIDLAHKMGRPYLAAVGHVYAAKAWRNRGTRDAVGEAKRELQKVPENAESFTLSRLAGKTMEQEERFGEALTEYRKAWQLIEITHRRDLVYAIEKTKLFRNLSGVHLQIARACAEKGRVKAKQLHLKEARKHFERAEKALADLNKHSEYAGKIERMKLTLRRAQLLEAEGDLTAAANTAVESYRQSKDAGQEHSIAKSVMYLVHICCVAGEYDRAWVYFKPLWQNRKQFTPPLKQVFDCWVGKHFKNLCREAQKNTSKDKEMTPVVFKPKMPITIDESGPIRFNARRKANRSPT
ncbi:MAG TPA: helix-turn-helix transcriptional regulator [Phycisphaerae bacterium]|nr:helix-turn-helix transcriptional regulator [Phycisphaerae bacterium]